MDMLNPGSPILPSNPPPGGIPPMGGGLDVPSLYSGMPGILIPKPFNLADPENQTALDLLKAEVIDKSSHWESRMTTLFGEYEEYIDSWRITSRRAINRPTALFNSKSGETHRATETQATFWFNQLTSADPFYYCQGEGMDDFGNEVSEVQLQAVEATIRKQLQLVRS